MAHLINRCPRAVSQGLPQLQANETLTMSAEFMENCTTWYCPSTPMVTGNVTGLHLNSSLLVNETMVMAGRMEFSLVDILKLGLEVLIAVFGVAGNLLVAILLSGLGKKKSTTDLFLLNLAVADLGILLLSFPLITIREKAPLHWPLGKFVCLYLYPVPEVFHGVSLWCIAVVAVLRYCEVVLLRKPITNKNNTPKQAAKFVAVCVWLTSFLLFCLPLYFAVEFEEKPAGGIWCGPAWPSRMTAHVYIVFLSILSYILPLIVISWTYVAISRTLNHSNRFLKNMKRDQDGAESNEQNSLTKFKTGRLRQNKHAKRILTPVVLVWAITLLPLTILRLTVVVWPAVAAQEYYEEYLLYIVIMCVMLNSSVNPVIYSIASKKFRRRVSNLCRRESHRGRDFQRAPILQHNDRLGT